MIAGGKDAPMLGIFLGYDPLLIREIERISPRGALRVEIFHDPADLLERAAQPDLERPCVAFIPASASNGNGLFRRIKAAPRPPVAIAVANGDGCSRAPAEADLLLRLPGDLPRLHEILFDGGHLADEPPLRLLEQRLASAQEKMQLILDQLAEGVAVIDHRGRVTRVNSKLVDLFGAPDASVFLDRPCHEALWDLPSPCSDCPRGRPAAGRVARTARVGAGIVACEACVAPLGDGVLETVRETATSAIDEAFVEAQKSKALATFAAGLAHELRNPLTVVDTTAQYCLEIADDAELRSSLLSIVKAARAAEAILAELLNFARPAAYTFEPVAVGDVIRSTACMIAAKCRKHGIDVAVSLPPSLPAIRADRARLQQALLNFMLNAVESMASGGTLTLAADALPGGCVEVLIADTGCGMSAEQLEKTFQPFYSTKPKGVGLGMPISRKIVLAHRGDVTVESAPDAGTAVRISLPAAQEVHNEALEIA